VLALRYFEDLPEAQIADVLGCSGGTVKSTTARSLERLRHVLLQSTLDTSTSILMAPTMQREVLMTNKQLEADLAEAFSGSPD